MYITECTESLLGRMEQLHTEICSLKQPMQLQADVVEDFRAITADLTLGGGTGASAALCGWRLGPWALAVRGLGLH